ncbi:hypothetical protein ACMA1D_20225 [Streptomyces sp. 796.1]|uniref:hypothetical protein n=1 Tax=Streptomyces sp. 796.1 TaxID=3163029 RepID=UPI0039C8EC4F
MWTTLIAVVGTLAGAGLGTLAQRSAERDARTERHHQQVIQALTSLLEAILRFRENYWLGIARLRANLQAPSDPETEYRLRSNITIARDHLALVAHGTALPALGEAAAWAAITLSEIPLSTPVDGRFDPATETALATARDHSRDTHTALREAGSTYLNT